MKKTTDAERTPMGLRIRMARKRAGLSHEQLARAVGCNVRSVYRYEINVEPKPARLAALSDALGVSMHWLATGRRKGAA